MDTVYIHGLQIETIIGINDWERHTKQVVSVNIDLFCDITNAARSDDISDAVDYVTISDRVTQFIQASEFQLIEAMAEQVADLILADFPVAGLKLAISKPGAVKNPTGGGVVDVGVVIERGLDR